MAEAEQLRVLLDDRRFTRENVNDAYALVAKGKTSGKGVVNINK